MKILWVEVWGVVHFMLFLYGLNQVLSPDAPRTVLFLTFIPACFWWWGSLGSLLRGASFIEGCGRIVMHTLSVSLGLVLGFVCLIGPSLLLNGNRWVVLVLIGGEIVVGLRLASRANADLGRIRAWLPPYNLLVCLYGVRRTPWKQSVAHVLRFMCGVL